MPRHVYECPLRWADMDAHGHVNNVIYVDYLQEARVDMLRAHVPQRAGEELAETAIVVRHEVDFERPLVHRPRPVRIECWVTEVRAARFTLAYEILDVLPGGDRLVYARAVTVLTPYIVTEERVRRITAEEREILAGFGEAPPVPAAREEAPEILGAEAAYACHVRFSDVDVYRHVNNVKYLEYFQEARILLVDALGDPLPGLVLARFEVDYRRPILLRPQPYAVRSWVSRVGSRSFTVRAEIRDGDELLSASRAVMVAFDMAGQRSVALGERLHAALEAGCDASRPG